MQKVRIKKVNPTSNPKHETAAKEEWIPGLGNPEGKSIPVEYTIEGYLARDIVLDKGVMVYRTLRNGEKADGIFYTSNVQKIINDNKFETYNSVYEVEYLDDDD